MEDTDRPARGKKLSAKGQPGSRLAFSRLLRNDRVVSAIIL